MAQPPTIAATAPPPPVDLDPVPGATRPAPSPLPASTVSPAIERFVRERARLATGAGSMTPAAEPRSALADRPPLVAQSRPPIEPSRPQELPPALPDPSGPGASDRQGPGRPAANLEALAATGMTLKRAPLDKADRPYPINLATALRLSDARPLVVAAAQAGVWVAEAELTRAKVLWVPTVQLGVDYVRHDGGGPDFNKGILTAPSVNYFYAGGTIYQSINLADAIFQPLAARQVLDARNYGRPVGQERCALAHRGRLLRGPPVPRELRRPPLRGGTRQGSRRENHGPERPTSSGGSRSSGRGTCWPTWSSGRPRPGRSGGSAPPTSPRSCGWTPEPSSSRRSTTTPRSP